MRGVWLPTLPDTRRIWSYVTPALVPTVDVIKASIGSASSRGSPRSALWSAIAIRADGMLLEGVDRCSRGLQDFGDALPRFNPPMPLEGAEAD